MRTQFPDWLAAEKRANRGGVVWPEPIVRGLPFEIILHFPLDVTADAFKMSFAIAPGASELVTKTASLGSYSDGVTVVTLSLTDVDVDTIGGAATDGDSDFLAEVVADLLWQEGGSGDWRRIMAVSIPVSTEVTND